MIREWRASLIVGWGMFVGGIATVLVLQPPLVSGTWTMTSAFALAYLVLFGTVAAFGLYLSSTRYIQPSEAGVLASVEPLTAIIFEISLDGLISRPSFAFCHRMKSLTALSTAASTFTASASTSI